MRSAPSNGARSTWRDQGHLVCPTRVYKNGRPHDVPLSGSAMSIVEALPRRAARALVFGSGEGGYSGWSRSKEALDASTKLTEAWTLHDLRRTAATRMADLGVQPHVIEAILNHVSGHKSGVAGIYNRSTYGAEKRAALELWASHLQSGDCPGGRGERKHHAATDPPKGVTLVLRAGVPDGDLRKNGPFGICGRVFFKLDDQKLALIL